MPIYNEAPSRVFGAMQAILEDVERTGQAHAFDFFFVSDTTDPNVWIAEERAFLSMRTRLPQAARHTSAEEELIIVEERDAIGVSLYLDPQLLEFRRQPV